MRAKAWPRLIARARAPRGGSVVVGSSRAVPRPGRVRSPPQPGSGLLLGQMTGQHAGQQPVVGRTVGDPSAAARIHHRWAAGTGCVTEQLLHPPVRSQGLEMKANRVGMYAQFFGQARAMLRGRRARGPAAALAVRAVSPTSPRTSVVLELTGRDRRCASVGRSAGLCRGRSADHRSCRQSRQRSEFSGPAGRSEGADRPGSVSVKNRAFSSV